MWVYTNVDTRFGLYSYKEISRRKKKKRRYSGINFESPKVDMGCLAVWSSIELSNGVHRRCTEIFTSYGFSDIASLRMSKGHVEG